MNGIIGMAGLLADTALNEEQREYLATIRRSADALLEIINDVLDFSKREAGRVSLERVDFELRACVEEAVEMVADRAFGKGVGIAACIAAECPTTVHGDPGRLRQILLNLLGNAVKFTDAGHVCCAVEPAADAGRIRIEVRDTGIGMSESVKKGLFQPFMQADASTTRRYGGTGLGLAISRQLAEALGGSLRAESSPAPARPSPSPCRSKHGRRRRSRPPTRDADRRGPGLRRLGLSPWLSPDPRHGGRPSRSCVRWAPASSCSPAGRRPSAAANGTGLSSTPNSATVADWSWRCASGRSAPSPPS